MKTQRSDGLELGDDPEFQRRSFLAQRVGWIAMILVLAAGMLGLLGGAGPLAGAEVGARENGIIVEYQRFIRKRSPVNVRIHVLPGAVDSSDLVLSIDRAYLERFEVQYINPEPVQIETGDQLMTFTFQLSKPGEETTVTFNLEAERFGVVESSVGLGDETAISFRQLIYP